MCRFQTSEPHMLPPPTEYIVIDNSWQVCFLNLEQHQIQQCKVPASWRKLTDAPASHELIYDRSCHLRSNVWRCWGAVMPAWEMPRIETDKKIQKNDGFWMDASVKDIYFMYLESSNWNNNLKVDVWIPGMYDQDGMCWDLFLKSPCLLGPVKRCSMPFQHKAMTLALTGNSNNTTTFMTMTTTGEGRTMKNFLDDPRSYIIYCPNTSAATLLYTLTYFDKEHPHSDPCRFFKKIICNNQIKNCTYQVAQHLQRSLNLDATSFVSRLWMIEASCPCPTKATWNSKFPKIDPQGIGLVLL